MNHIRILIADNHDGVRTGIKMQLQQHPNFLVVAEARSGSETIQQTLVCRPDVVVMDVRISGISSPDVCDQILHQLPNTRIIMLSTFAEDELLSAALYAGAVGYVLKRIRGNALAEMIEAVVVNQRP